LTKMIQTQNFIWIADTCDLYLLHSNSGPWWLIIQLPTEWYKFIMHYAERRCTNFKVFVIENDNCELI